jgi:pimeloyl-ACP methyl ester carboxylesterase
MPLVGIAGSCDPRYLAQGARAASAAPNVTLLPAPGAAHRVPWEAGEWFRDAVVDFVRRVDRATPLRLPVR